MKVDGGYLGPQDEGTDGSGAAAAWCFIGALLTVLAAVAWAVLA